MFELTSLLVAISASSASFVAILGGFIASKLLSISGERELTEEQLINVNKEIQLLQEQNREKQYQLDEEDAIQFIIDNIEKLISDYQVEEVYDNNEQERIEKETLKPFWEKAQAIVREFLACVENGETLNGDNIPISMASKYRDKTFEYTICRKVWDFCEKQNSLGIPTYIDTSLARTVGLWYSKCQDQIQANNEKLTILKFKQEQLQEKEKMLKSPKGVKLGFLVFAIFTILCVVAPLCFVPFKTENYGVYLAVLYSFIGIFILGLVSVFLYLLYLLSWKKLDKAKNCK